MQTAATVIYRDFVAVALNVVICGADGRTASVENLPITSKADALAICKARKIKLIA